MKIKALVPMMTSRPPWGQRGGRPAAFSAFWAGWACALAHPWRRWYRRRRPLVGGHHAWVARCVRAVDAIAGLAWRVSRRTSSFRNPLGGTGHIRCGARNDHIRVVALRNGGVTGLRLSTKSVAVDACENRTLPRLGPRLQSPTHSFWTGAILAQREALGLTACCDSATQESAYQSASGSSGNDCTVHKRRKFPFEMIDASGQVTWIETNKRP